MIRRVSLVRKRPELTREEFVARWTGGHGLARKSTRRAASSTSNSHGSSVTGTTVDGTGAIIS